MNYSEAGKGSAPRKQADNAAYRNNYDIIFRRPKDNPATAQDKYDNGIDTKTGIENEE